MKADHQTLTFAQVVRKAVKQKKLNPPESWKQSKNALRGDLVVNIDKYFQDPGDLTGKDRGKSGIS